jgi:hypothetical protein
LATFTGGVANGVKVLFQVMARFHLTVFSAKAGLASRTQTARTSVIFPLIFIGSPPWYEMNMNGYGISISITCNRIDYLIRRME